MSCTAIQAQVAVIEPNPIIVSSLLRRIKVDDFDFNKKCQEIAIQTEGLSGREIAKLGIAWQVRVSINWKFFTILNRTCHTSCAKE